MKKFLMIFFLLVPISIGIFSGLFQSLNKLKPSKNIVTIEKHTPSINDDIMLYTKLLTECFEKYNYDVTVDCEKKIKESASKLNIVKKEKNNYLIEIIYALMTLALNTQLAIFIYVILEKEKVSETYFHLSDWAINSPPMLGVLGTIISFALLVGTMKEGNIQDVFTKSFFDAAITTIIGGLIYVFNLLLKVKIHTHIRWVT